MYRQPIRSRTSIRTPGLTRQFPSCPLKTSSKDIRTARSAGEKNISRYEVAQIIARLVARKDSLTADQQATVDKLAQSYRDDLANLGVRVTELEKKTGHTELITELRIQDVDRYGNIFKGHTEKDNELSTRVRLNTITTRQ